MSFDNSTLYLFSTLVAGMLGAMLIFFGKQENIPALKGWGTAYLLGAASVALWTLAAGALGELLSLALNAVGFVACGVLARSVADCALVFGAIAWIGAAVMLPATDSAMRLTVGAAIVAIYAALTASELWNERRRSMQKRWPAIAVPVMHGCVLMLPVLLGDLLRPHDRTRALCDRHRIRHLHAGVGSCSHRPQDGGLGRPAERDVQPPRLCRSLHAGDRT